MRAHSRDYCNYEICTSARTCKNDMIGDWWRMIQARERARARASPRGLLCEFLEAHALGVKDLYIVYMSGGPTTRTRHAHVRLICRHAERAHQKKRRCEFVMCERERKSKVALPTASSSRHWSADVESCSVFACYPLPFGYLYISVFLFFRHIAFGA